MVQIRSVAAALCLLVCMDGWGQDVRPPVYVPEGASKYSDQDAARIMTQETQRRDPVGAVVFEREIKAFTRPSWVTSLTVRRDGMQVVHEKGTIDVAFATLPRVEMVDDSLLGISQFGVSIGGDQYLWFLDASMSSTERRARAVRFADALYSMRTLALASMSEDARFVGVAAQYRAAASKPPIPEEVRRFQVQAEYALDNKRYADAARLYGEGLRVAPWWAQGRFNRALLLAELGSYREATAEMQRYLQLEPNAPDARQAQDRIYQWEAAMQMGVPAPGATGQQPVRGTGMLATTAAAQGGGCFVATAAYGSSMHPQVNALREFRDRRLMSSWPGTMLVGTYYRYSPPLADTIARNEVLRTATRWALWPIVLTVLHPWAALAVLIASILTWRLRRRRA